MVLTADAAAKHNAPSAFVASRAAESTSTVPPFSSTQRGVSTDAVDCRKLAQHFGGQSRDNPSQNIDATR